MNQTQLAFVSFIVAAMGLTFVGLQKSTMLPDSIAVIGWAIAASGGIGMVSFGIFGKK